MADGLREPLAADVEMLRIAVLTAGVANAKSLRFCAEEHIASINRFVEEQQDLQTASFLAIQNVTSLGRSLYQQACIVEIEDARRQAMISIDRLVEVLRATTPNQRARSLGFAGELV